MLIIFLSRKKPNIISPTFHNLMVTAAYISKIQLTVYFHHWWEQFLKRCSTTMNSEHYTRAHYRYITSSCAWITQQASGSGWLRDSSSNILLCKETLVQVTTIYMGRGGGWREPLWVWLILSLKKHKCVISKWPPAPSLIHVSLFFLYPSLKKLCHRYTTSSN